MISRADRESLSRGRWQGKVAVAIRNAGSTMPASVFPGLGLLSGLPCFRSDVREWTSRSVFADFGEECLWAVRLANVGVAAGGARLGLDAAERMGGDDNDWEALMRRVAS